MVQLGLALDSSITRSEFYKVVRMVQETDAEYMSRPTFSSPAETARFINEKVGNLAYEVFGVVLVDTKNRPTGWAFVGQGALSHCPVDPRNIILPALISGAAAILLFHNHPSGDPKPSRADLEITKQLAKAAKLFNIRILDHLIIGGGSKEFFSMQSASLMPELATI